MKLDNPNRSELSRIPYLSDALDWILSAISATFNVEHHDDGTHGAITCDSISVRAIPSDATSDVQTDGNITGSLIPTTATQDLGGLIASTASVILQRPWRTLYLSNSIQWTTFGSAPLAGDPTLTRSGATMAWAMGVTGRTGTYTVTATDTAGVATTLTVRGANVQSSTDLVATANVRGAVLQVTDGVTAPAAVTGVGQIYIDTADGDLKVIFGDGVIKTIVVDT